MFKFKTDRLKEALAANDVEKVREIVGGQKDAFNKFWKIYMDKDIYHQMSPEMFEVLAKPANEGKLSMEGWTFIEFWRCDLLRLLMAIEKGQELVQSAPWLVMSIVKDNRKYLAAFVEKADVSADAKATVLRIVFNQGGVAALGGEHMNIARAAIKTGAIPCLDVLSLGGVALCANSEELLRFAAEEKKEDICLYLVRQHGADAMKAADTSRELGRADIADYLVAIARTVNPDAKPAVDAMTRIVALERTVAELTRRLEKVEGGVELTKPLGFQQRMPQ